MKQIYFVVLTVCALCVSPQTLHSQEFVMVVDSSITYEFTSPGDSLRFEKQITTTLDSAFIYVSIHKYRWDDGLALWENYRLDEFLRDSWNNILTLDSYSWDDITGERYHSYTELSSVDSLGNMLSTEAYVKFDPDDPWSGSRHETYEFDTAGNRTMETYFDWNDSDQLWVPAVRHVSEYDTTGRLTLKTNSSWNTTLEQWEEYNRRSYEYTEHQDGSIASQISYRWNEAAGEWERWSMISYEYSQAGMLIREISHDPIASASNDEWHQDRKTEYDYDAQGNRILLIYYRNTASYPGLEWEGTGTRTVNAYTPEGEMQLHIRHRWDDAGEFWKFNESDEYLFNEYGFKSTRITYEDEGAGADSVLTEKEFFYPSAYYYTIYDVMCEGGTYSWEGQQIDAGGSYEKSYVSVMGADSVLTLYLTEKPNPGSFSISGATEVEAGQEALYLAPVNEALEYSWAVANGSIVSGANKDTLEVRWENEGEGEVASWALNMHGCSSDTTALDVTIGSNGLDDLSTAGIVLYPIPVKEVLQVQSDLDILEIEVVDLNGREVLTARGTSVDLSFLESGIYLVRLRDPDGILMGTQKILKE